jgi:hypothetical protein
MTTSKFEIGDKFKYLNGFNGYHQYADSLPMALPGY